MAPLVPYFDVEKLPYHVNIKVKNFDKEVRRKGSVDLEKCKLMEMVQYSCNPPSGPHYGSGTVVCEQIVRLFRRCADGLTVETTSWEPIRQAEQNAKRASEAQKSSKT